MANELILGSQAVFYAKKEPVYGVPVGASGTDAMYTISESFTPEQVRDYRPDRSGSSDHLERFIGRTSATWEVTKLVLPNGSVTTTPDDNYLWENLFGHVSIGTTSIEYLFATAHDDSLTLRRGIRTGGSDGAAEFQEHVFGAIVNRGEISWGDQGSNGLAQVKFSGMAKKWGYTGNTSLATTVARSVSSTDGGSNNVTVANIKQLSPGSLVYVGASRDSGAYNATLGAGIVIKTVNYTNQTFMFNSSFGSTHSRLDRVVAYNPTAVTSGSPLSDTLGWLSLDGSTTLIKHLGGTVTIEDNRTLLNEEVGEDSPSLSMRENRRAVTFALNFIVRKEAVPTLIGDMVTHTAKNVQVTLGSYANKKVKLNMANARFDMTPMDIGDQGMARVSMNGVALGTNGNDSLKVRIL